MASYVHYGESHYPSTLAFLIRIHGQPPDSLDPGFCSREIFHANATSQETTTSIL